MKENFDGKKVYFCIDGNIKKEKLVAQSDGSYFLPSRGIISADKALLYALQTQLLESDDASQNIEKLAKEFVKQEETLIVALPSDVTMADVVNTGVLRFLFDIDSSPARNGFNNCKDSLEELRVFGLHRDLLCVKERRRWGSEKAIGGRDLGWNPVIYAPRGTKLPYPVLASRPVMLSGTIGQGIKLPEMPFILGRSGSPKHLLTNTYQSILAAVIAEMGDKVIADEYAYCKHSYSKGLRLFDAVDYPLARSSKKVFI